MAIVEFRTGEQDIPEHLAEMMRGIETFKLTVEEAIDAANKKMLSDHIRRQYDAVISDHFKRLTGP